MVKQLKEAVGDDVELTVAGGITTLQDLETLFKLGVKGQVRGFGCYNTQTSRLGWPFILAEFRWVMPYPSA